VLSSELRVGTALPNCAKIAIHRCGFFFVMPEIIPRVVERLESRHGVVNHGPRAMVFGLVYSNGFAAPSEGRRRPLH
jgi:hypothetical protein